MNQRAWKYLRDRLDRAIDRHRKSAAESILSPDWVKELKATIKQGETRLYREHNRVNKIRDAQRYKIIKASSHVEEKMILDDAAGALRLLRLFERSRF